MCSHCLDVLRSYGRPAEQVFVYCTTYFLNHNKAPVIEELNLDGVRCPYPLLMFMEAKGLISTTECGKDSIAIKTQGLNFKDESTGLRLVCFRDHL